LRCCFYGFDSFIDSKGTDWRKNQNCRRWNQSQINDAVRRTVALALDELQA
jgi:hypothetical protein